MFGDSLSGEGSLTECDRQIFADTSFTLEDLMREKGELVKRGSLRENGDIEFWDKEAQAPD